MDQGYTINRKARKVCQAIVHKDPFMLKHINNSQLNITVPITITFLNGPEINMPTRLQALRALMYDQK